MRKKWDRLFVACLAMLASIASVHAQSEDILDSLYDEFPSEQESRKPTPKDENITQAKEEDIDSLLEDFFKETQEIPTVKDCEPTKNNPYFPDSVYKERLENIRTVINMPYNSIVRSYIDKYCNKMRLSMSAMLGASNFYMPVFQTALESEQLPDELKYLPIIESALNPKATSPVGAAGLWQFMPATGRGLGLEINSLVDERRDLEKSSYAAATLLRKMYNIYHDWSLVIAAYNCGPGNVNKAIKRSGGGRDFWEIYNYLPRETRGYVPSFIAATYVMTYYCEHGICPVACKLPSNTDTIMVSKKLTFTQVASASGASIDMIKKLNPQYRANQIPGSKRNPCSLRLPEDNLYKFIQNVELPNGRKPTPATTSTQESAANNQGSGKAEQAQEPDNENTTDINKLLEEVENAKQPDEVKGGENANCVTPTETTTPKPGKTIPSKRREPRRRVPVSE